MHDQRLGAGMQLRGLIDRQREGFGHRQPVVILGGRVARRIEHSCRRRLEAPQILGQRDFEPLAIGGGLLVGERKAAERLRQRLGGGALRRAAGAGHKIVGADLLRPEPDLHRRGDAAPGMRVRGDQHPRRAAGRQVGLERLGIERIVEDQQDAFALVPQPLSHRGKRRLLLLVGRHPAEPHAKPDQVGAHAVRRLRPDPPGGAVVAAMALGVGRRQRGLADPAQAVQRGDGDAALVPRQAPSRWRRAKPRDPKNAPARGSGCWRRRRLSRETRPWPALRASA